MYSHHTIVLDVEYSSQCSCRHGNKDWGLWPCVISVRTPCSNLLYLSQGGAFSELPEEKSTFHNDYHRDRLHNWNHTTSTLVLKTRLVVTILLTDLLKILSINVFFCRKLILCFFAKWTQKVCYFCPNKKLLKKKAPIISLIWYS